MKYEFIWVEFQDLQTVLRNLDKNSDVLEKFLKILSIKCEQTVKLLPGFYKICLIKYIDLITQNK